jgi:hypothetical protein
MKKQFSILFSAFLLLGGLAKAQAPDNWHSMGVNIHDGTNRFSGVEGYCELTTCNGVETVLLKLVNLNAYTVKAAWKDMVLTQDDQRLSRINNNTQDSVTIAPGSQVVGDCSSNNSRLVIKLSDFGTDGANFKNFLTGDFDFVIIHNQH